MELRTLTVDEILLIYDAIVEDFAADNDPIAPAGVRSRSLLESAVGRQFTGAGPILKYPSAIENAASLTFGLCNDHPFYNGNKRTALVAMLVHLDRNKLSLQDTGQDDLYTMILSVAQHSLSVRSPRRSTSGLPPRGSPDEEVKAIAAWIRRRIRKIARGERQLSYRQLRRVLETFGYSLSNPHANAIDVVRFDTVKKGILRRETKTVPIRVSKIGYHDEGTFVALKDIKLVRKACKLREEDGIPSDTFYGTGEIVDAFVNRYRTLLRRLGMR